MPVSSAGQTAAKSPATSDRPGATAPTAPALAPDRASSRAESDGSGAAGPSGRDYLDSAFTPVEVGFEGGKECSTPATRIVSGTLSIDPEKETVKLRGWADHPGTTIRRNRRPGSTRSN